MTPMIELYRTEDSKTAQDIENTLQELVLAHEVITVSPTQASPSLPPGISLPALRDEGQFISGDQEIKAHLLYLTQMAHEWRKYQSDACYIDGDDGNC
jgi:hypothetical protein